MIDNEIFIDQATDNDLVFTLYEDSVLLANLINLTGYRAAFWIRNDKNKHVDLKIEHPAIPALTISGAITVPLSAINTENLVFIGEEYQGRYELRLQSPALKKTIPIQGVIKINRSFNRSLFT